VHPVIPSWTRARLLLHEGANLPRRRQHTYESQRTSADDFFAFNKDREFTVAALNQFHLEAGVATQRSRHPGGVNARDSIRAAPNRDTHPDLQSFHRPPAQIRLPSAVAAHMMATMNSAPPMAIVLRAVRE
jgi:hypothetical protein